MTTGTEVQAIFWGAAWTADTAKITALESFYSTVGGSPYMRTNLANAGGPLVSTAVHYGGSLSDGSSAPRRAPKTSEILAEVQKMVSAGLVPVANGYYPVYVDTKRGGAGYCAWHSWGTVTSPTVGTVNIQFGFFFNLDGDSGCDPQDTSTGRSQGIAALANVTGHELSEVATDPRGNAWFDRQGYENADKCAWTFNGVINLGSGPWKVQSNFANDAYDHSNGIPRGCINTY